MGHNAPLRTVLPACLALAACWAAPAAADAVEKRDGRVLQGDLVSVDREWVVIRTGSNNVRVPRNEVAAIRFEYEPEVRLPQVEIRNVRSSDAIDVLLEDQVVIRDAGVGGSWVDLTSRLKDGNNGIRFRIRNEHGGWGYHLQVRIDGEVFQLACGKPPTFREPCRCCGKIGNEKGVIDDLPPVWIFVDRHRGLAELVP